LGKRVLFSLCVSLWVFKSHFSFSQELCSFPSRWFIFFPFGLLFFFSGFSSSSDGAFYVTRISPFFPLVGCGCPPLIFFFFRSFASTPEGASPPRNGWQTSETSPFTTTFFSVAHDPFSTTTPAFGEFCFYRPLRLHHFPPPSPHSFYPFCPNFPSLAFYITF